MQNNSIEQLEQDSLDVLRETGYHKNTSERIGSLFYRIVQLIRNVVGGTLYLGERDNETTIKAIVNPTKGDTYKAKDTGDYWTWNGATWENVGKVIPSDVSELTQHIQIISNDEFLYAILDSEERILFGIRHDATYYFATDIIPQAIHDKLKEITDYIAGLKAQMSNEVFEEYLHLMLDNSKKILSYYKKDGTFCPQKLQIPDDAQAKIIQEVKDLDSMRAIDLSSQKKITVPLPTSLCTIKVQAPVELLLDGSEEKVTGIIELISNGWYIQKFIEIKIQGSSSRLYPRKNWSISLYNDEACTSSCDIKFGNWVFRDGFHIKANYIDALHTNNLIYCRLAEDIYQTRPLSARYPYSIPMDINNPNEADRIPSGAMCHIDGFAGELYLNHEYDGICTFNLTKHRSNYLMKKSEMQKILLEMSAFSKVISPITWEDWELRNPELLNLEGGKLGEGEEPEESETKRNIIDFFDWVSAFCIEIRNGRYYAHGVDTNVLVVDRKKDIIRIDNNGNWIINGTNTNIHYIPNEYTASSFKEHILKRMPLKFWVDYFLLHDLIKDWDSVSKNTLLSSYDGFKTVYPNNYDMDSVAQIATWRGVSHSITGGTAGFNANIDSCQPLSALYYTLFFSEISDRYRELRQLKVFDVTRITNMHLKLMTEFGVDAYKRTHDKWTELPNNRANNVNTEFWNFKYETNNSLPLWNNTTAYTTGNMVRIAGLDVVFTALKNNTGKNPLKFTYNDFPKVGGFYNSIQLIETYLTNQIQYLDNYYN